jgi:hypothetical protein
MITKKLHIDTLPNVIILFQRKNVGYEKMCPTRLTTRFQFENTAIETPTALIFPADF